LLLLVPPVPPNHPGRHLCQIRILAIDHDDADFAPILVGLAAVEGDIPVEDHVGQMPLRCLAEWLLGFGCIDAGEPNLVLLALGVKNCDRVAVADTDDPALNGLGVDGHTRQRKRTCEQVRGYMLSPLQ
jgi:hypothetical protein